MTQHHDDEVRHEPEMPVRKIRDLTVLLRGSIYSGLVPPPASSKQYPVRQVMEFALDLAEVLLAIVNMKMIDSRYGIGIASTGIPDVLVPKPRRRKYRARYKNRPKPRTTTGPLQKRGERSAIPAQMQPPPIS